MAQQYLVEISPGCYEVVDKRPTTRKPQLNRPPRPSKAAVPPWPWRFCPEDNLILDQHGDVVARDVEVVSESRHNNQIHLRFMNHGSLWVGKTIRGGIQARPSRIAPRPRCTKCGAEIIQTNVSEICRHCHDAAAETRPKVQCTGCGKPLSKATLSGLCRACWLTRGETRETREQFNPWLR
jgi:ribosomal protein S14